MAGLGPDGTAYVTQGQAEGILARLVEGVQGQMTALNVETRGLIDQLRLDVQQAITANGQAITTSEENAQRQVEALRSQAQAAAVNLDGKIAEAEARLASAIESAELYEANKKREEAEFNDKMAKLEKGIHDFAAETQRNIQQMIADGRSAEGSPMKPFQERDRAVFDPRDYKIETIPTQMSLGVWKKWRHEVEIYVDTIGPSWRGIKLVMQQARHSAVPIAPTVAGMDPLWQAAKKANDDTAPFDPAHADYAAKAVTLYRLLVPKLNFDLSTEFRNSAPDNGFELWRLLQRKLDPPRADVEFHLVNDIRKHARTSCANFDQTV